MVPDDSGITRFRPHRGNLALVRISVETRSVDASEVKILLSSWRFDWSSGW